MIVLAALVVISTVVVEFAYNAHIAYEVAATERERLKATYLAYSGYQLVRMMLQAERQLRQQFAPLLEQLSGGGGISSDPFCKLFPVSSGLVQGLSSGLLTGEGSPGGETAPEEAEEAEKAEKAEKEDLFNLGGDFEAQCDTEERKINLNAFWQPPDRMAIYDQQRNLLTTFLLQKSFESLFHERRDEALKVVQAIADWIDPDERVTDASGLGGGYEDSEYASLPYKPKNGKLVTTQEILLVPGVGDDLYNRLAPNVTVYGDDRINLCQADEAMTRSFLVHYAETTPGAARLDRDDETRLNAVRDAILEVCAQPNPQPQQIANLIASQLGGGTAAGGRTTGTEGQPTPLANRISTTNRFYSIDAKGIVGEIKVTLKAVLDTGTGGDPNSWKLLYFLVK